MGTIRASVRLDGKLLRLSASDVRDVLEGGWLDAPEGPADEVAIDADEETAASPTHQVETEA